MNVNKRWQAACILLLVLFAAGLSSTPARSAETATYTVNSLADTSDGFCNAASCTLREAIIAANSNFTSDTILFSVDGTITPGASLPTIVSGGSALTIDGSGREIIISGANSVRILLVNSGISLTLRGLTFEDGYTTTSGAAIYSSGNLVIDNCTFMGNRAGNQGGAIYHNGYNLTITGASFSENATDVSDGGALYIHHGTVSITGSDFRYNTAGYSGGAIYNRYESESLGGNLTITGTMFAFNRAWAGSGGAVANDSDAVIDGSTFAFNTAEDHGGGFFNDHGGEYTIRRSVFGYNVTLYGHGGGLYLDNVAGSSSVYDSTLQGNVADADGGGFYVSEGTAGFHRTRIKNNDATNGGGGFNYGGLVYLLDSTIEDNSADQNGGGFYNGLNMAVARSTFLDNDATEDGGGVYHADDASNAGIENSTFYANRARRGGGLFLISPLSITNCTISANSATEGGGIRVGMSTILKNTILANSPSGGNCNAGGTMPGNGGNNIDSGTTCNFGSNNGSMSNTNPLLGPLRSNGGPTQTLMLLSGSPAVDAVIYNAPNSCPAVDQRGYPRPFLVRCDIGAVEQVHYTFVPLVFLND